LEPSIAETEAEADQRANDNERKIDIFSSETALLIAKYPD
jgi:hypothetical protein